MSKRSIFSYGLGIGLVVGAVLLEMITVSSPKPQANELDDSAKINELADNNGYKLVAKSEILYSEQQVKDRIKQALEAESTPAASPSAPAAPAGKPPVIIYISEGNNSSEIAAMLAKAGLIVNAASFEEKLRNRKIDTKIDRGTFKLSPDMSEDDIISKIVIRSP